MTVFVLVIIRWMGHKELGPLNMYELLIVIGSGTAIGEPTIYDELSLPNASTSVLVMVIPFKMLDFFTTKNKKF